MSSIVYKLKEGETPSMMESKRQHFFISLCGPLCGLAIEVNCIDEDDARLFASENLGKIWCSVYQVAEGMSVVGETVWISYQYEYPESFYHVKGETYKSR